MEKSKRMQNRGKSSKETIFQGLANFYLIANENIHGKQFCLGNLHVLKVNWKIWILSRKIKENSGLILAIATKKIINNFFLLFWKANFWNWWYFYL